jgi:ribosomal protein S18 acetylase RimI-like enzyme
MPGPTIRCASEPDIESVLELWHVVGSAPGVTDTRQGVLCLLATAPEALLVADLAGTIVGSLIAGWDGWRGSFYRLGVHPDHRRRGIGVALLREGERRLRARGALRLTAIVTDGDLGATTFWRAAGYTRQDDRVRYVRHIPPNA